MVGCLIQTTLSNTAQCFRLFRDLESKSQGVHVLPQKTVALSLSNTLRYPNAEPYHTFKIHFNVALTIYGQTFEVVLAKMRLKPTFTSSFAFLALLLLNQSQLVPGPCSLTDPHSECG